MFGMFFTRLNWIIAIVGLLILYMTLSGCGRAYTLRFVMDESLSTVRVGDWVFGMKSYDFCAYKDYRFDIANLGERASIFGVGLVAMYKRADNRLPPTNIAVDTLNISFWDGGKDHMFVVDTSISPFVSINESEVTVHWSFIDTSGAAAMFIPEEVDSIRIWFNARVTAKSIDLTVNEYPVELVLLREKTSKIAPPWLIRY